MSDLTKQWIFTLGRILELKPQTKNTAAYRIKRRAVAESLVIMHAGVPGPKQFDLDGKRGLVDLLADEVDEFTKKIIERERAKENRTKKPKVDQLTGGVEA